VQRVLLAKASHPRKKISIEPIHSTKETATKNKRESKLD
jgi:hypothetical protein